MSQEQNDKISPVIKGNRLCVNTCYLINCLNMLPNKLKMHKAFILRPALMYC